MSCCSSKSTGVANSQRPVNRDKSKPVIKAPTDQDKADGQLEIAQVRTFMTDSQQQDWAAEKQLTFAVQTS